MHDFGKPTPNCENPTILWTAAALPSVVGLCAAPIDLVHPDARFTTLVWSSAAFQDGAERLAVRGGETFRAHVLDNSVAQCPCAILPLDDLFDVRVTAARRLWRALNDRSSNDDPARLPATQRNRLVQALRALDARLDGATYREVAAALFGPENIPERGWKTHDLRDRAIRLAHLGTDLMQGGYRRLLLYPFRQRL